MKFELKITQAANQDMDKIFSYIVNHLCNLKAANDLADAILAKYDEISVNPYMFEESRDIRLRDKGYRRIPVQKYVILYKVNEENKEVIITRVFYCGQNYKELI